MIFYFKIAALYCCWFVLVSCAAVKPVVMYDGAILEGSKISVLQTESIQANAVGFPYAGSSPAEDVRILDIDGRPNTTKSKLLHILPGDHKISVEFKMSHPNLVSAMSKNTDDADTRQTINLKTEAGETYTIRMVPDPLQYWVEKSSTGEVVHGKRPRWMKPLR